MKTDNNITATPSVVLITETSNTGLAYPLKCDFPLIRRDAIKRSTFMFSLLQLNYAKYCLTFTLCFFLFPNCFGQLNIQYNKSVVLGADQVDTYLPILANKNVGF